MNGLPEVFKNTNNNLITSSGISLWLERWFLSSNAKDIGTLYLIFALLAGLVGTAFSVLIRLELSGPGVQFIADNQLYNSIITAHAIVIILTIRFRKKSYYSSYNSMMWIMNNPPKPYALSAHLCNLLQMTWSLDLITLKVDIIH